MLSGVTYCEKMDWYKKIIGFSCNDSSWDTLNSYDSDSEWIINDNIMQVVQWI